MWEKFKLWLAGIKPELIKFIKAAVKMGIDILLPIAIEAVVSAERHGGTGKEKFDFACDQVKAQAPKALAGAVMTAVQNAWAVKEADGWEGI